MPSFSRVWESSRPVTGTLWRSWNARSAAWVSGLTIPSTGPGCTLLAAHTRIEEEIFYPAVRSLGTDDLETLVDEALEEHHVVDLVLAELPRVHPGDDRFAAKMTVLSELVEHHVKEEERDMFRRAQALGTDRLKELGARLEQAAARHLGKDPERSGGARAS